MIRSRPLPLLAGLLAVAIACPAFAVPSLLLGEWNQFKYNNVEVLLNNDGSTQASGLPSITAGDEFLGVFNMSSIFGPGNSQAGSWPGNPYWAPTTGDNEQLTGMFYLKVTEVVKIPVFGLDANNNVVVIGYDEEYKYDLGTSWLEMYWEAEEDFQPSTQTFQEAWETAGDGTFLLQAQFTGGYYTAWDYGDAQADVTGALDVEGYNDYPAGYPHGPWEDGPGNDIDPGGFWSNLAYSGSKYDPAGPLAPIHDLGIKSSIWVTSMWDGQDFTITHAKINGGQAYSDTVDWTLNSEDPVVGIPTPEPATLCMLGLGLAGYGYRRRRRSMKK
jgi:hypothetical protein